MGNYQRVLPLDWNLANKLTDTDHKKKEAKKVKIPTRGAHGKRGGNLPDEMVAEWRYLREEHGWTAGQIKYCYPEYPGGAETVLHYAEGSMRPHLKPKKPDWFVEGMKPPDIKRRTK